MECETAAKFDLGFHTNICASLSLQQVNAMCPYRPQILHRVATDSCRDLLQLGKVIDGLGQVDI